jgi:hypothetical protein
MKRILLVGALAVAWAAPAAAQRSPLFMCLQLAPAGLSVERCALVVSVRSQVRADSPVRVVVYLPGP